MASLSRSLLARGYATAASSVKPPVQLNTLTGTYATSTYLAAAKKSNKELDSVANSLQQIQKSMQDNANISVALGESQSVWSYLCV